MVRYSSHELHTWPLPDRSSAFPLSSYTLPSCNVTRMLSIKRHEPYILCLSQGVLWLSIDWASMSGNDGPAASAVERSNSLTAQLEIISRQLNSKFSSLNDVVRDVQSRRVCLTE